MVWFKSIVAGLLSIILFFLIAPGIFFWWLSRMIGGNVGVDIALARRPLVWLLLVLAFSAGFAFEHRRLSR